MNRFFCIFIVACFSLGIISCSHDDNDDKNPKVENAELYKEYKDLLVKINRLEKEIASLKEQMKTARGGRLLLLQQEEDEKRDQLLRCKSRARELERKLGLL